MQAVVLCGGLARRLGELSKNKPKALVDICGKPFIEYQIELLRRNRITDIVLCVGHFSEQIRSHLGTGSKFGVNIKYSVEQKLLGTAGALKKAEPYLKSTFFTMYGDSYLQIDFNDMSRHFQIGCTNGLMAVFRNSGLYDVSNTVVRNGIVVRYDKLHTSTDMVYIDYGLHIFKKDILDLIPEDTHVMLDVVFHSLIDSKQLGAYEVSRRFFEIGSIEGITEFKDYIRKLS